MADYIIKDIEELIKSNRGDLQRLIHIKDDFEKTKIITLSDRKYVESLASRYLKEAPIEKKRDFMKSFQEISFKKPRMPEPTKESLKPQTQESATIKAEQTKLAEVKSDRMSFAIPFLISIISETLASSKFFLAICILYRLCSIVVIAFRLSDFLVL